MRGGVLQFAGPVAGAGDDLAAAHQHGADRHFAARRRGLGLGKRQAHEIRAFHRHTSRHFPRTSGTLLLHPARERQRPHGRRTEKTSRKGGGTLRAAGNSAVRATVVPPDKGGKPALAARAGSADLAKAAASRASGPSPRPAVRRARPSPRQDQATTRPRSEGRREPAPAGERRGRSAKASAARRERPRAGSARRRRRASRPSSAPARDGKPFRPRGEDRSGPDVTNAPSAREGDAAEAGQRRAAGASGRKAILQEARRSRRRMTRDARRAGSSGDHPRGDGDPRHRERSDKPAGAGGAPSASLSKNIHRMPQPLSRPRKPSRAARLPPRKPMANASPSGWRASALPRAATPRN